MRLTLHTDYALRVLIYLATQRDHLVSIKEISEVYGISLNHLRKVIHKLSRKAFIDTIRGRHGGMTLLKQPQDIFVGAVVRATEDDLALVGCMQPDRKNTCILDGYCVLKGAFYKAQDAFLEELDKVSLADILSPEMRSILNQSQQENLSL